MISYKIMHHIPGRIRIEVPFIKTLSTANLLELSGYLSAMPIPEGIKEVRPSLFSASVVITYETGKIDIVEYIKNMASSIEIQKLIGG
jgi:hypothetical protein